jgi:hypothetical protein
MDAATLARADEPFFTTKPRGQGTGLGLSMARGFAEQSGGGFAIVSALGQGTSVSIWLPQATAAMAHRPKQEPLNHTVPQAAKAACILVVDDDALVREMLSAHFVDAGYIVREEESSTNALTWLEAGSACNLLLTDFCMPGMDGIALIHEMQNRRPELQQFC